MSITLQEDWTGHSSDTEIQSISGWTGYGTFAADAAGLKVNATDEVKNSSTNGCLVCHDAGSPSHYSEAVMRTAQTAGVIDAGVAVRCGDHLNFIGVRYWGSSLEVFHKTGDATYNRIEFIAAVVGVDDLVKLEVDGDTLRCYVNSVQVGSDNDITGIQSGNNAGLFAADNLDPIFGALELGTLTTDIISITPEADRKVFPVFGATRNHTISGTYSGVTTPAAIEYRVEEFVGGALVSDWATLDAAPSVGTYSGIVAMPKGNFYKILTRFSNLTSITASTNRIGFGILAEFAGQSNTVSLFATGNVAVVNDNTAIFDGTSTWASPNTEIVTEALNALAVANSCAVGCYNTAVGATSITEHLIGGSNYAPRESSLTAAGGELNFIYLGHGENDTSATYATYQTNVGLFYTDILTRTGQDTATLPMFIAQLGRNEGVVGNDIGWQTVRAAQSSYAELTSNVYISHQTMDLPMADTLHRNNSGSIQECLRFADSFNTVYSGLGDNGRGVIPASASIDGSDVIITHNLNGSTAITLPVNSLDGYEVSEDDFSTLLTINSISTATDKITLTLSSAPAGEVKIRSQQGQDPDNAKMPTGDITYNAQAVMVEPIVTEIQSLTISSTLNMTVTGANNDTLSFEFYDRTTKLHIKDVDVTFSSSVGVVNFSLAAGAIIGAFHDGATPPTTGTGFYGVTE